MGAVRLESGHAHDGKPELKPAWCFLAAPVAIGLAVVGLVVAADAGGPTLTQVIGAALVALWSAAGIALGVRLRRDRLGPIVLAGAVATGVVCLAQSLVERAEVDATGNDTAEIVLRVALGLLPAFTLHLLVALPDGRLTTSRRRCWRISVSCMDRGPVWKYLGPHRTSLHDIGLERCSEST